MQTQGPHNPNSFFFFFFFFFLFHYVSCLFIIFVVKCEAQVGHLVSIAHDTPALHVFGDSTVSCGSFNDEASNSHPPPYGIDSYGLTSRYTNGYTVADELGVKFNLTVSIPQWVAQLDPNDTSLVGFNYASAYSGILPGTGSATKGTMNVERQIEIFEQTINNYLSQRFQSKEKLFEYLSNSMYIISIGSHDYLENFPAGYNFLNTSIENTRVEFSNLISQLQKHLTELYKLGARKMIVFELGPIGCYPVMVGKDRPEGWCSNELNGMIALFNGQLYQKLVDLTSSLADTTFILVKTFRSIYDMVEYPYKYKFADSKHPCCKVDENGGVQCVPWKEPCRNRDLRLFWDKFHLTWAANRFIGSRCLEDPSLCLPVTFNKLEGGIITESGMPGHRQNFSVCVCSFLIQAIIVTVFLYFLWC